MKKILIGQGFEVFRSVGSRIALADRVRENLIMDSGVSAIAGDTLGIRVVLRAQGRNFPDQPEEAVFAKVTDLGQPLLRKGYSVTERAMVPVSDPSAPERILETWFEVAFERHGLSHAELESELHFALSVAKSLE